MVSVACREWFLFRSQHSEPQHPASQRPDCGTCSRHADGQDLSKVLSVCRQCTGESSLKAKNTRRDPRVALSIVDFNDPYNEAQLRGRIVDRRTDPDLKIHDSISHKYTGQPFPMRSPEGRVALIMEVEKAHHLKLPFKHQPPK